MRRTGACGRGHQLRTAGRANRRSLRSGNTLSALAPYEQLDAKVGDIRRLRTAQVLGTVPQADMQNLPSRRKRWARWWEFDRETGDAYSIFAAVHRGTARGRPDVRLLRTAGFADANCPSAAA